LQEEASEVRPVSVTLSTIPSEEDICRAATIAPGFDKLREAVRKLEALPKRPLGRGQRRPPDVHHNISGHERLAQFRAKREEEVRRQEERERRAAETARRKVERQVKKEEAEKVKRERAEKRVSRKRAWVKGKTVRVKLTPLPKKKVKLFPLDNHPFICPSLVVKKF
jgi:hypothetical protein